MSRPGDFVPAPTVRALLEAGETLGLEPSELATRVGLDEVPDIGSTAVLPRAVVEALWRALERQHPAPTLRCDVALAVPFGAFGSLDYLVGSAGTVGEALYALRAHLSMVASGVELQIEHRDDGAWVGVRDTRGDDPLTEEFTLAVCVGRFKTASAASSGPRWIGLRRQRSEDFEALLGATIRFEHPTGVMLSPQTWSAEMQTSDPRLHQTMRALAERITPRREQTTVAQAVRARLRQALAGAELGDGLELTSVARSLGMSTRTLQRRLAEADVRFSDLLDAVREQEAMRRIRSDTSPLAELARQLGYADQTALSRAFRRWTGRSIRQWTSEASHHDEH